MISPRFSSLTLLLVSLLYFYCLGFQSFNKISLRKSVYSKSSLRCSATPPSLIEDDGYSISHRNKNAIRNMWNFVTRKKPGTLILVRHGETTLNYNQTFTGWIDTDLSDIGIKEVEHGAALLMEKGISVDVAYTSRLKRAIRSTWILLIGLNELYRPVYKSWRLNERMYGDLEGKSKPQAAIELGKDYVQNIRRGLLGKPPIMKEDHPHWHKNERKYSDLDVDQIPLTESLQDTMSRTIPLWKSRILPDLRNGNNVLIVAHANSLRGIVKLIDGISADDIIDVHIPNGIPLVYKFDRRMRPQIQDNAVAPLSGEYLEEKGLLKKALAKEEKLARRIPGMNPTPRILEPEDPVARVFSSNQGRPEDWSTTPRSFLKDAQEKYFGVSRGKSGENLPAKFIKTQFDPILDGLTKLNKDRELMKYHQEETTGVPDFYTTGIALAESTPVVPSTEKAVKNAAIQMTTGPKLFEKKAMPSLDSSVLKTSEDSVNSLTDKLLQQINIKNWGKIVPAPQLNTVHTLNQSQVIVIIRHGKTEYNRLSIFTGWEDAPLISRGRVEARKAGHLLKLHGVEFDEVYTSWLSRAIETAWIILDELDMLWLPIAKSWRLNERMYGALTGLSKSMIAEKHGQKQFKSWRRGYDSRPPETSSFSSVYPGNDDRYVKNQLDIRFSFTESLIRTIAHRRLELHRKFPKTESLKDCMSRTIPYFQNVIVPRSISKGKNVLISSSENAIRGLLMYLCDIPEDRIAEVEIPTGLPLVYDLKRRCIQLLDDGEERDNPIGMMSEYDFGTSPNLLFRPCDADAEECFLYQADGVSYAFDPIIRLSRKDNDDVHEYDI